MDNISKIKQLAEQFPKHFSQMIKRDAVLSETIGLTEKETLPIAELAFRAVYPNISTVCELEKNKKFKSYTEGYGFCGPASKCECARDAVASAIKQSAANKTDDQKAQSTALRKSTNIKKYGVTNAGQLAQSIQGHSAVYADPNSVQHITSAIKATKQARWGDADYNNSSKIRATWQSRKTEYWQQRYPDKDIESLASKETMQTLFDQFTPEQIADQLKVHVQTVYKYLIVHKIRTPYKSSLESEMIRILQSWGVTNIVQGSKSLLPNNKQVDIWLPDYNLAIEMNGVYWHHEEIPHITKHYHRDKFIQSEAQSIQLITIFSNYWDDVVSKEKILRMLRHKLGLSNSIKMYARKTQIVAVSAVDAKQFMMQHHLQNYTPAKWHIGLTDDHGMLVAVMSFAPPRVGIGKSRPGAVELVRYATSCQVIGGAGKLLKHFIDHHPEFDTIISYSNNEWSNGKMYRQLGFELEKDQPPSYFYFSPALKKCLHRFNFAKHKLIAQGFDPVLSEGEIQRSRGYLRIWDCGKRTWRLTISQDDK